MEVVFKGSHMTVSDDLQDYIRRRIDRLERYLGHVDAVFARVFGA